MVPRGFTACIKGNHFAFSHQNPQYLWNVRFIDLFLCFKAAVLFQNVLTRVVEKGNLLQFWSDCTKAVSSGPQ